VLFGSIKTFGCLDELSPEFGYFICLHSIYSIDIKVFVGQKDSSHNIEDEEDGSP
jgi:hypothetical protein